MPVLLCLSKGFNENVNKAKKIPFQIAGSAAGGVSSPGMVSLNSVGTASPAGTPAPPAAPPSPTQQQHVSHVPENKSLLP